MIITSVDARIEVERLGEALPIWLDQTVTAESGRGDVLRWVTIIGAMKVGDRLAIQITSEEAEQ